VSCVDVKTSRSQRAKGADQPIRGGGGYRRSDKRWGAGKPGRRRHPGGETATKLLRGGGREQLQGDSNHASRRLWKGGKGGLTGRLQEWGTESLRWKWHDWEEGGFKGAYQPEYNAPH